MLSKLKVELAPRPKRQYPIVIGREVWSSWQEHLPAKVLAAKQIVIITDESVKALYAKAFARQLRLGGYQVLLLAVKAGEESKSYANKEYLETQMLKERYDRHCLVIAFGGGVVGDLSGFVAATYLRGVDYIQMPTTLLAMIDSSVGGKTSIDTPYGKNLIGAFWQPKAVIMDLNALRSLPKTHLVCGIVEALKIFLTKDAESFFYARTNLTKMLELDLTKLQSLIRRAVKLKAAVVQADEQEDNLRMILNFGHTVGHALEKVANYKVLHGYAVGLGILLEAKIALMMGILSAESYALIVDTFALIGITKDMLSEFKINDIIKATANDKKNKNGNIYCVLLKGIGKVYAKDGRIATQIDVQDIKHAYTALLNEIEEKYKSSRSKIEE